MKKIYKLLIPIFALVAFISINPAKVHADEEQNADFEIQPIMPSNQVNTKINYFDLQTKSKMKQTISMRVQNFTNHKIVVQSDLRNAKTNIGGGIGFQKSTKNLDPSLKVPFTDVIKLENESKKIYLGPKEAKIINADINMPVQNYRGIIYGDWHFIEYVNKKTKETSSISSNYAYSLGISLRGSDYNVYPMFKYKTTEAILYNRHPAMGIKLRNIKPMELSEVSMKGTVKKIGSIEDERSFTTTGSSIAPNSEVTLPISWAYDSLKPGKYKITAKVHGYNFWNKLPMNFKFSREITIKKDDADRINKQSLKRPVNKWAIAATASGALLLVSVVEMLRVILKSGV